VGGILTSLLPLSHQEALGRAQLKRRDINSVHLSAEGSRREVAPHVNT